MLSTLKIDCIVKPFIEYAKGANIPNLIGDINYLERVQRLTTRLVRGLHPVPYEERLHQLSLFSLECKRLRDYLAMVIDISKCEVNLSPSDFFLRQPLAWDKGAHLQNTIRIEEAVRF